MNNLVLLLRTWSECHEQLIYEHRIESAPARTLSVPFQLPSGYHTLYSHQVEAVQAALSGQHVAIATPTASGKTLATALAYLETRRVEPDATLLCLAPTRALVEQWCQTLVSWNPDVDVEWFTGDTPRSDRAAIRKRVQILVTTPDMLHRSVLPYHRGWRPFLQHLREVIVDESHTYRGVFGSHMALILRRLQRVASLYNDRPFPFLLATATIVNASDHAAALVGQGVTTLTQSGAPRGERAIALWQPPEGRSHSDEAVGLMAFFVSQGVRTLLFGQQRQSVERMALQVQDRLSIHLRKKVAAYRAGFLDSKRKEIQRRLSSGELVGVVSTNALELGIDIGELDVVILDGFPGSVASFWQQAGRAGRGTQPSLVILVLRQNALDQYFAAHPSHLCEASSEQAVIDLGNPYILPDHLRCAAHERRLTARELSLFGDQAQADADLLASKGYLAKVGPVYVSQEAENPAYTIPLRDRSQQLRMYAETREQLEEIGGDQAVAECYPGAIYLSQGTSYEVTKLDLTEMRVDLKRFEGNYYTKPIDFKELTLLDGEQLQKKVPHATLFAGRVHIIDHITGYGHFHKRFHTKLEERELTTPLTTELDTQAFWLTIDRWLEKRLPESGVHPLASLHAAEHAIIALLPLCVLCDPRDMGGISFNMHPQAKRPLLCIYDGYQGGVGYARKVYQQFFRLAAATLDHLRHCQCLLGCPACVQSPRCGSGNDDLDKKGAVMLLQALLTVAGGTESGTERNNGSDISL
jgi:DEAD/DEAH box helicase domain-containing protein